MSQDEDLARLVNRRFYRIGLAANDHAKAFVTIGFLLCIGLSSLAVMGPEWMESYGSESVESIDAVRRLDQTVWVGDDDGEATQEFTVLIYHPTLMWNDSAYMSAVNASVAILLNAEDISVSMPWDIDEYNRSDRVSPDGHYVRVLVEVPGNLKDGKTRMADIYDTIVIEDGFTLWRTSGLAVAWSFDERLQDDLTKAELISAPLSLLILMLVFGSVVAALLPLTVGAFTVAASVGMIIWISNITDVTQYSINIISLIGIGVSIDYSLFMIYRFREELENDRDVRTAVAITTATAGKAVFYSGLTVAIGLMGLLFFSASGMPSLGLGGTMAVTIAMIYSVLVLPAILALLGHRVNNWKVPFSLKSKSDGEGMWANIATVVMKRPWAVLIPLLVILLAAGAPFLRAEFSLSSWQALPPGDESRVGLETQEELWPEMVSNQILMVIDGSDPLSEQNLRANHAYAMEIMADDHVMSVIGLSLPSVDMSADEVVQFWQVENLPGTMSSQREALRDSFYSEQTTYLVVNLEGPQNSVISRDYVEGLRENRQSFEQNNGVQVLIGGFAAYNLDVVNSIAEDLPGALIFILSSTLILVFIQVRSIVIPIKAVAMNILSISASFGMLVWVFQDGNGAEFLNFTPQPIDSTNPVIMFCIVFGLSMDYEVLMLSRIHEEWERTGDNEVAVAKGLQKTGMLITGAAAIMVVVFGSFGLASVVIIKQIGLGLALAILIDATIVRALIVPATMRLMGKANWWSPKWLSHSSKDREDIEES
jgi:RND superfamily putative drug exporter